MSVGKAAFEAGMHAISSGLMSAIDNGNFGSGFLSGLLSSAISSTITALGQSGEIGTGTKLNGDKYQYAKLNKFGGSSYFKAAIVASGGLSGGIGASIAGGSFWKGVRQGLITSGLNHLAHMGAMKLEEIGEKKSMFSFM